VILWFGRVERISDGLVPPAAGLERQLGVVVVAVMCSLPSLPLRAGLPGRHVAALVP